MEDLTNLPGEQGYPGNVAFKKVVVYATKVEFGTGWSNLDTEHGIRYYTLGDKCLE
jgi:hypothetical protein